MRALRLALGCLAIAACDSGSTPPADAGPPDAPRTYVPQPFEPTDETRAYCGERDDDAIEEHIGELLAQLTIDEKVSLLHGAGVFIMEGAWLVKGVERLEIPPLHMLDGPRGVSAFTGLPATTFPVAMLRGATFDAELEQRVGAAIARELRAAGGDVLLAPTINVLRHPRWGRAQETYGEDTHLLGELGVAFIRGVQSEDVLASVKHYAVNSIENTRHEVSVTIDERTLREVYLPHFRRAVQEARVASVMSAYNQVNGHYCDQNEHLLRDILKDEWGFAGFVESDWILGTHGDVESLRAGLDVEMPTNTKFKSLAARVESGEYEERELDESVRRVLRARFCFGLESNPPVIDDEARETAATLALAREVAERGIVLLRNEVVGPAPTLPLDASAITRIAVLGRNADVENIGDTGSSNVIPTEVITALEGIRARAGTDVEVEHVTTLDTAGRATVAAADAVIVITGLQADDEGESTVGAGDRASLALPAEEVQLVRDVAAANDRVIVVLEAGAAITSAEWDDEIEALLFAFYPGARGGEAIASLIFGDASPSGRLPFSVPTQESDLPEFDNEALEVEYGFFHGYRHLDHEGIAPHYPFGFGLAYTTFTVDQLVLESDAVAADGTVRATVRVTNDGDRAGRHVVQAYVGATGSRVERAERDLRAFAVVELDAGESATVTLEVAASDLAFYDVDANEWVVEPIEYDLRVAAHAADVGVSAPFTVE